MLPQEQESFFELITELFAVHGRNASKAAMTAWWGALKSRDFSKTSKIVRQLIEESTELPTPARVISLMRDGMLIPVGQPHSIATSPSKTTLLAARRTMEMHGERHARDIFGDYAVNILLKNPRTGYSATCAQTYGGVMPDFIKEEIKLKVRHV